MHRDEEDLIEPTIRSQDIRLCKDPCRQPTCVWCRQHGIYDYKNGTTSESDLLPEVANTWVSDDIHMAKTLAKEDVSTSGQTADQINEP